jgi:hypothetical protein
MFLLNSMGIYENYKQYKILYPSYEQWKSERDLQNAKRLEYLRQTPAGEHDTDRGKALLRAVDVMDDYSQSYAEDTEVATEIAVTSGLKLVGPLGGVAFGALGFIKPIKNLVDKVLPKSMKGMAPLVLFGSGTVLATLAAAIPAQAWAARQQVKASRYGRIEAMEKDLANPVHFAVLTEEQKKQAQEIAAKLPDKDFQKIPLKEAGKNFLSPFIRLKEVTLDSKKKDAQMREFYEKIDNKPQNFNQPLSAQDIENAKKDQQLLGKIVEKIDIASQDYAENVELATNTVEGVAFAGGGLVGFLANSAMKLLKVQNPILKTAIPTGLGVAVPILFSIAAANIQKQASKVGRFKVKQELENNPQEFAYVDDEKARAMNAETPKPQKQKNVFKFMIDAFKDNKEYNNWLKTEGLQNKKLAKAITEIKLTPEQQKQAKMLQKNAFKIFTELDEKSQLYSESTEAFWEIIKLTATGIADVVATIFMSKAVVKAATAEKMSLIKQYIPLIPAVALTIILDIICTKEQKKASRVASMEALKELSDYRNYADYENANAKTNLLSKFMI